MANEKTPVVWDDTTKKHRPLGTGEKMGGLDASSLLSSDSGNLLEAGSDGLAYLSGSGVVDPRADNLLEESDRGKLQVTVDRIAEWLDGHPQDAAVLADAINVVSGDSGNVIVEGTDKGAFLSKGAIAAAVAGMTDAQKAQLADAIAARIASDIADGKTIVASGGKLTSDPTNATVAQKKAINQALADADSGLVVNNSTGKLQVDFSNMPTDKFEELLKGLKMQIPLSADLDLYVDAASDGDSLVDGRGTASKPFRHIQNCVNYATQTYAIGSHCIYINVRPGTYSESITLPTMTRTSGGITLRATDESNPPVLVNASPLSTIVSVTGSGWTMRRFSLRAVRGGASDGLNHFPSVFLLLHGSLALYACNVSDKYSGAASSSGYVSLRTFAVQSNSTLDLHGIAGGSYHASVEVDKGNASGLTVFLVSDASQIVLHGSNDNADYSKFYASGVFGTFADVSNSSTFVEIGGSLYPGEFVVPAGTTAIGKKFDVDKGGGISLAGNHVLPGDAPGTPSSTTYGWYIGG